MYNMPQKVCQNDRLILPIHTSNQLFWLKKSQNVILPGHKPVFTLFQATGTLPKARKLSEAAG